MYENKQYVRKHGGLNFASAMLSFNIGTDGYIRHITGVINRFLFNGERILNPIISGDSFCIIYNNKIVLSNNFDFVESCRAVSFREFEKILIKLLEGEGCIFDKGNYYYESIMAG
jgi:hypothetical protein